MGKYKDKHGYSRFQNFVASLFGFDPADMKNIGQNYLSNFMKATTQSGVTQQQVELNDMQMQNVADQYGKEVEGMQAAGLNPALMYKSGATSAPTAPSPTSNGSMSDLMQLVMLPLNKKMLKAQIANVEADTQKKGAETENIKVLTPAQYDEVVSKIRLNNKGLSEADARIAADLANAALASVNTEWYGKLSESEINYRNAQSALAEAQKTKNESEVKEIEARIAGIKQDIVESMSRCVVNAANAGYLDQATLNLMEEQGLIEVRRAAERTEYLINDKILNNYDTDKWFIRFQQGTAGIRDIGIGVSSFAGSGIFAAPRRPAGYGR